MDGDGNEKENLINKAKKEGLDNIVFMDRVPKSAVREILNRCDAVFINLQPTELYKFGISLNKMFDYMLENKVVFMATWLRLNYF